MTVGKKARKPKGKTKRGKAEKPPVVQEPLPLKSRLHTEIETETKHDLDRACLERSQLRTPPYTQYDIVQKAVREWLDRNGYSKD